MTGFQDRASLCCPRSVEGQRRLGIRLRIGRGGERLVQPSAQVAMREEIHAQQRNQVGQAPAEAGDQLQVTEQQHGDQRRPDLDFHRVGRGADEGLDLQVLLERLEEQFHLPALLVDGGHGGGAQAVMVGEKHQRLAGVFPQRFHPAQQVRAFRFGADAGQADGLILEDVPVLRHGMFLDHFELGVVLHAGDEEHAGCRPVGEQAIVVVAPVVDHHRAGREGNAPGDLDVMDVAFRNHPVAGQVTIVVEHQMQFHRPLGAAKSGPVELQLRSGVHDSLRN